MNHSNDIVLMEKSLELSTLLFNWCKTLPEDEPTIIHIIKESAINLTTHLDQEVHSSSSDETLFCLDHCRGMLHRIKSTLNISSLLNYISKDDINSFNIQLDSMLGIIVKKINKMEQEAEEERMNFEMNLPSLMGSIKLPGSRKFDS